MFFSKKKCKLEFSNNPSVFTCSHVLDDGKPNDTFTVCLLRLSVDAMNNRNR